MKEKNMPPCSSIRFPVETYERIRDAADKDDRSINYWIIKAAEMKLDMIEKVESIGE